MLGLYWRNKEVGTPSTCLVSTLRFKGRHKSFDFQSEPGVELDTLPAKTQEVFSLEPVNVDIIKAQQFFFYLNVVR